MSPIRSEISLLILEYASYSSIRTPSQTREFSKYEFVHQWLIPLSKSLDLRSRSSVDRTSEALTILIEARAELKYDGHKQGT